jgi:flagella basal body P-ring formation protein FlgA
VIQTPLKNLLLAELMEQVQLAGDQMQVDFDAKDEEILALTSPTCRFEIDDKTAAALGPVAWVVMIKTDNAERIATIKATAHAWEDQLVLSRPLSKGQAILKSDIAARRVLVEKFSDQPLTKPDDLIGQVAARDMKAGDVLTAGDATAAQIIEAGQFMTVSFKVAPDSNVETVARALEAGAAGKTVRARNESTGEIYHVRVTGPNAGEVVIASSDDGIPGGNNQE